MQHYLSFLPGMKLPRPDAILFSLSNLKILCNLLILIPSSCSCYVVIFISRKMKWTVLYPMFTYTQEVCHEDLKNDCIKMMRKIKMMGVVWYSFKQMRLSITVHFCVYLSTLCDSTDENADALSTGGGQ